MKDKPIVSQPPSDSIKRFVLGKEGTKCLLVICLNPSTADISGLDDTTRNIETIAELHEYDGWILFNLSAQRSTDPEGMHNIEIDPLQTENWLAFMTLLNEKKFGFSDVLFAWGNNIELRPYLSAAAIEFMNATIEKGLNPKQIRLTKKGHPIHPSSQALSRYGGAQSVQLSPFDISQYRNLLEKTIK